MSGLFSNVAAALAVPWQTSYVAPTLMALTGVAYALRGYEVGWSEPTLDGDEATGSRDPSRLTYMVFTDSMHERVRAGGVEPSCLFPYRAIAVEHSIRNWRAVVGVTLYRMGLR